MRRKPAIPQRAPIFIGCEGESEIGYAALLNHVARELGLHIHIHAELLQPGAGDPHVLVNKAAQKIASLQRTRERFAVKAVLLDLGDAQKMRAAKEAATLAGIKYLIWQEPDHEGMLLRHLDNCHTLRPPAGASLDRLREYWPDYEKIGRKCNYPPGLTWRAFVERVALNQP